MKTNLNLKKIILGLILLSSGITINTQAGGLIPTGDFTFGAKVGLNFSNVWDEKGLDFQADPKIGLAGGVFLGVPIGKILGFQPEILISQKGLQGSGTLLGLPYSFSRTTTYIDVPLQLQVKPTTFLTLVVGPKYSFLMHEKNIYTLATNSAAQEEEFSNDNIRRNIFGVVAGADFYISHLVLSGRIGWDLQTNNGDGTSSTPRYKNQWLQLTAGFKL